MKRLLLLLPLLLAQALQAQDVNWAEDIAPIFFEKCASCHHDGGIAPFTLTDYQTAKSYASLIEIAIDTRHMPPWPPDPNYNHLAFERILTEDEKFAIKEWIMTDAAPGDLTLAPSVPVFPVNGDLPGTPDLIMQIPAYTIQATTQDEYRCFVVPNDLPEDRFITAWEIVPGNREVVHHVVVYQDDSGQCAAMDAANNEPGYSCFGGACNNAKLFGAWAPGGNPLTYPDGMGIRLKAGTDVVIELHYPAGTVGQEDDTEIHFFFAPAGTPMREVKFDAIADPWNTNLNTPFTIPPNQVKSFNTKFNFNFGQDFTLLRVLPHMHLLGKSMKAWMVEPAGDTIPLISIPEWDFHWQGMYGFQQPIHVKNGSNIGTTFTYDNTTDNPNNPNFPPQTVHYGEETTDEMMFLFIEYLDYEEGDENIVFDSSILTPVREVLNEPTTAVLHPVQPNPVTEFAQIPFYLNENQSVTIKIFDLTGREVAVPLLDTTLPQGENSVNLQGKLSAGVYFVSLTCENGTSASSKFVVK